MAEGSSNDDYLVQHLPYSLNLGTTNSVNYLHALRNKGKLTIKSHRPTGSMTLQQDQGLGQNASLPEISPNTTLPDDLQEAAIVPPNSIVDIYRKKKQTDDWSMLQRHWKNKDEISYLKKHEMQKKMKNEYK